MASLFSAVQTADSSNKRITLAGGSLCEALLYSSSRGAGGSRDERQSLRPLTWISNSHSEVTKKSTAKDRKQQKVQISLCLGISARQWQIELPLGKPDVASAGNQLQLADGVPC